MANTKTSCISKKGSGWGEVGRFCRLEGKGGELRAQYAFFSNSGINVHSKSFNFDSMGRLLVVFGISTELSHYPDYPLYQANHTVGEQNSLI